jgi:hypothetical protein
MYALLTEVKPRNHAVIIESLVFLCELEHQLVGTLEMGDRDRALLEELDSGHKPTEVHPVVLREYIVQQCRTIAKYIYQVFPSLVPTGDLLCRISRGAIKRARQVWSAVCNILTMQLPDIPNENNPVPEVFHVFLITVNSSMPQTDQ